MVHCKATKIIITIIIIIYMYTYMLWFFHVLCLIIGCASVLEVAISGVRSVPPC